MTVIIINSLVSLLSRIKLNKISDKETKMTLLKDFLALKQISRRAEENRQELIDKLSTDWAEEFQEVGMLRAENKPVDGHKEFLEAEADTVKLINEIFTEDVEVNLTPVELDKFVDSLGEEELTLEAIAFLQENGIIV